jgi:diaminopropionate ammonia-lyase
VRSGAVRAFHQGLPGHAPTPLTEVPALAAELGAARVFVKDESSRLGLPAFKILGASWAVRQLLRRGTPVPVPTAATIMAGLNCGTVSTIAWPYLSAGLDAAVAVSDAAARRAVADLAAAGICAGPSGAASLAGARAVLTGPGSARRRGTLALGPDPAVVLLSTEAGPAVGPPGPLTRSV